MCGIESAVILYEIHFTTIFRLNIRKIIFENINIKFNDYGLNTKFRISFIHLLLQCQEVKEIIILLDEELHTKPLFVL